MLPWVLMLVAAVRCTAAGADDLLRGQQKEQPRPAGAPRFLTEAAEEEDYRFPMCGYNKARPDEDPVQRFCLRQCRVEKNGMIRPTFDEWEKYCRDTAAMENWDQDCMDYLSCTYGCAVWGGDRDQLRKMPSGTSRKTFLQDSLADMYETGISQEKRCDL